MQAEKARQAKHDFDMKEATFHPQINTRGPPSNYRRVVETKSPDALLSPRVEFTRHNVESVQNARNERGCMHGSNKPLVDDGVRSVEWTLHCDSVYLRQTQSEQPSPTVSTVYGDHTSVESAYSPEEDVSYIQDPSPEVRRIESESMSLESEVRQMMSEWKQFDL